MDAKYGDLNITCHYTLLDGVFKYEYEWVGGKYLAISRILAEAIPEFDGQWIPGNKIKIGPFTMEVLGTVNDHLQDMIVCKRLTPIWLAKLKVWLTK